MVLKAQLPLCIVLQSHFPRPIGMAMMPQDLRLCLLRIRQVIQHANYYRIRHIVQASLVYQQVRRLTSGVADLKRVN